MKTLFLMLCTALSVNLTQAYEIGQKVDNFKLMANDKKIHSLSEFKGKVVVLEWLNHGCPYVRKHYDSNNMQSTQKFAQSKGVIWLSVISSSVGKQGHVSPDQANEDLKTNQAASHLVLIDETGVVGKKFGAKTTPHLFILNEKQELIYEGAIDSINSTDKEDINMAKNYVKLAINDYTSSKKVSIQKSKAYGCSVKY